MKILRRAILTAGAAATILSTTTPAHAATAAILSGSVTTGCFGCGPYDATFTVTGVWDDTPVVRAPASARFAVFGGAGAACVVSDVGSGTLTVSGDPYSPRNLHWVRTGAYVSLTVAKAGRATISANGVLGVVSGSVPPCGGPVSATFDAEAHG